MEMVLSRVGCGGGGSQDGGKAGIDRDVEGRDAREWRMGWKGGSHFLIKFFSTNKANIVAPAKSITGAISR